MVFAVPAVHAQNSSDPDLAMKHALYTKYRKEVLAYDKKHYDELFFAFFEKQNDPNITLTKEEYYTYTIKIAIYSEKLGMLYKDQKEFDKTGFASSDLIKDKIYKESVFNSIFGDSKYGSMIGKSLLGWVGKVDDEGFKNINC